ncbi:MAG: DUF2550 family protein [Actinomycetaceae bacterium]|nr:DUF2550 family protein [Actinomycetaceae bacterium]
MFALTIILGIAVAILLCLAGMVSLYAMRMHRATKGAAFECDYRPNASAGWTAGFAVYGQKQLNWYRLVSFRFGPDKSWSRRRFRLETPVHYNDVVTVPVRADGHRFYLAMKEGNHTGLVSWSEAAPPLDTNEL